MIPIPQKLIKRTLIKCQQRRIRHNPLQRNRNPLLRGLEEKASQAVALKQVGAVIHTAGDRAGVDACEGVHGPGVPADGDDVGVFCCEDGYVSLWVLGREGEG